MSFFYPGIWINDKYLVNRFNRHCIEKIETIIPESGELYCSKDDLINCSALALGSPTRFGSIASPMKYFLDSTGDLWGTNALENKPGMVFTSTSSMHGGQETTLFSLITFMLHHGMIISVTQYSIDEQNKTKSGCTPNAQTPYLIMLELHKLNIAKHVEVYNKASLQGTPRSDRPHHS